MHIKVRGAMLAWLIATLWLPIGGCRRSDRRIHVPGKDITVEKPIQLPNGAIPYGASRDGSRIVLYYPGQSHEDGFELTVIDTDTQRELGRHRSKSTTDTDPGTVFLSADARSVYFVEEGEYLRWNYETHEKTSLGRAYPSVPAYSVGTQPLGRWNSDRSLAMTVPRVNQMRFGDRPTRALKVDGQIAVAGGKPRVIPYGYKCGFDMYGAAWFGKGTSWTRVDKSGEAKTFRERPAYLTGHMAWDRGNLHLALSGREERFKGARASVTCVWLYSDRATPFQRVIKGKRKEWVVNIDQSYRAAIVFAAVDLLECGFLPGRDMIYVVTDSGSYLVPFSTKPEKIDVMDEPVPKR